METIGMEHSIVRRSAMAIVDYRWKGKRFSIVLGRILGLYMTWVSELEMSCNEQTTNTIQSPAYYPPFPTNISGPHGWQNMQVCLALIKSEQRDARCGMARSIGT